MMADFKKYLEYLSPKYQICEIDFMLKYFYKSSGKVKMLIKRFNNIINEFK